MFRLSVNGGVRDKVVKAQNVIMQNGADKVVKLFSQYTLTTTLNYFCCLSDEVNYRICLMMQATIVIGQEYSSRNATKVSTCNTTNYILSRSTVHEG